MTRLCRAHHLWSECFEYHRYYIYYFKQYFILSARRYTIHNNTDTPCRDFPKTRFYKITENVVTVCKLLLNSKNCLQIRIQFKFVLYSHYCRLSRNLS